jgi:glutamyl-tRNA reductase
VVTRRQISEAVDGRGDRPLCILDIALPRDVEADVGQLDNVFLYDLDDLRAVVAANVELRRAELPSAEQMIEDEVERYWQWLAGLAAVPVVASVRTTMDRVRADELSALLRRIGELTPKQREAIEHFSRALMNKFLHQPSVRLRAAAATTDGVGVVEAARYLFALDESQAATPDVGRRTQSGDGERQPTSECADVGAGRDSEDVGSSPEERGRNRPADARLARDNVTTHQTEARP